MARRRARKSAVKSASAAPVLERPVLLPQPHGGALLAGGIRGLPSNGGRPPDEFKRLMAHLASRARTIAALSKILKDPDHEHFMKALVYASNKGYPELADAVRAAELNLTQVNVEKVVILWGDQEIPL